MYKNKKVMNTEEKNTKLQEILSTYIDMDNKELTEHIYGLEKTFNELKESAFIIILTMEEVQEVHDKLYDELNKRLKFDNEKD